MDFTASEVFNIYPYIELLSGLFNPFYDVVGGAGPADAVHGVLRGGVRVGAAGQPLRDRGGGPQQGELWLVSVTPCWALIGWQGLHSAMNYYLVSLAVADALIIVLGRSHNFVSRDVNAGR